MCSDATQDGAATPVAVVVEGDELMIKIVCRFIVEFRELLGDGELDNMPILSTAVVSGAYS